VKTKRGRRQVVREEFEDVDLGDRRRSKRASFIADRLAATPEASLPAAMRDRAGTEALYRHLESDEVTLDRLLAPHIALTVQRVQDAGVAFAIADTSVFKFSGDADREGLGPIQMSDQGFLTHLTLAVSADGRRTPLGVLGAETWARAAQKTTPRAVSESSRWWRGMKAAQGLAGTTPLIHVADRESDIYDLLAHLDASKHRFILRAAQDRMLVPLDEDDERRLFDAAQSQPTAYVMEVPLSARKKAVMPERRSAFPARRFRTAQLSFAALRVHVKRPKAALVKPPDSVAVNVVHVFELGPPPGEPPVEWVLLTSEPVSTPAEIAFVVEGYRTRWLVEEDFKAAKTGCAFESRQLESFHTLTNMLAYVLVIAYAMLLLRSESRDSEQAQAILTDKQLAILRAVTRRLPANPTVRDTVYALAGLGGHLKNNGDPGWRTLSKGWRTLLEYETGYDLAMAPKK